MAKRFVNDNLTQNTKTFYIKSEKRQPKCPEEWAIRGIGQGHRPFSFFLGFVFNSVIVVAILTSTDLITFFVLGCTSLVTPSFCVCSRACVYARARVCVRH